MSTLPISEGASRLRNARLVDLPCTNLISGLKHFFTILVTPTHALPSHESHNRGAKEGKLFQKNCPMSTTPYRMISGKPLRPLSILHVADKTAAPGDPPMGPLAPAVLPLVPSHGFSILIGTAADAC